MHITFGYQPETNCTHISVDGVHHQELQDQELADIFCVIEDTVIDAYDDEPFPDINEVQSYATVLLLSRFPSALLTYEPF